jgi:collagenase-like PrtC family protease
MISQLTMGPLLFHWPPEKWRDFYFSVADEAPVDIVYIGEVVCSKRTPFTEELYGEVAKRLVGAGKKIIYSTLAEVMIRRDRQVVQDICAIPDVLIEANDAAALPLLEGRKFTVGPFFNVYNEDTLTFLAQHGAVRVCLSPELPADSVAALGKRTAELGIALEAQVYGRMPLALSARCYHARAHGRVKDNCQFVCGDDPDGMDLKTLEGKCFLTVNGIQTLSYKCLNLAAEMDDLLRNGVSAFRLSPHSHDMIAVARVFRQVLEHKIGPDEAISALEENGLQVPFTNGFYHKKEGYCWIDNRQKRKGING